MVCAGVSYGWEQQMFFVPRQPMDGHAVRDMLREARIAHQHVFRGFHLHNFLHAKTIGNMR